MKSPPWFLTALVVLSLFIGYAIAQSVDPLGDADVVGIFQKLPEGVTPLQFSPQTFNVGVIREGEFQDYPLLVTNPNAFGLNITWAGPQVNATVPIQVRLQLGGVTFSPNTFLEIGAGQTLSFTARVRMNDCPGCVVGEVPFKASFLFSGINGSVPSPTISPGTAGSMLIINAEARAENFTIFWDATFENQSVMAQDLDAIVRLQRGNDIIDLQALRISIPASSSETISGKFDIPLTTINGTVYQMQFEALTLPIPGQDGSSFALTVIDEIPVTDGVIPPLLPAGEPEGFIPEAELEEPEAEAIPEIDPVGGMIPIELLPAIILMGIIVAAVGVGILWSRRSKARAEQARG